MLLILLILENCSNLCKIVYHTDFVDGNYENLVFYVHWKNVWKSHNLFYMATELVGISEDIKYNGHLASVSSFTP